MAKDDDKNKFSKREERKLRSTSSCKQPGGCPGVKRDIKNIKPFASVEDSPGEIIKRSQPKVRYERISQKGYNVAPPKKEEEEKVVHTEEKFALFEKQKGAATKKDIEDIEQMNRMRKIETKTISPEEKKKQYEEGERGGFKTSTRELLTKKGEKKEPVAYLKSSEGYKKPKGEEEYKFRSTREDAKTRMVAKYEKEGGGEITTINKEARGAALRELSKNRKKAARIKGSEEKLKRYYKRKGVTEKVTF